MVVVVVAVVGVVVVINQGNLKAGEVKGPCNCENIRVR